MKEKRRNNDEMWPIERGEQNKQNRLHDVKMPKSDQIPFRLRQSIQSVLDQKAHKYAQSEKQVGTLRLQKRSEVIFDFFGIMWGLHYKIESLSSLKQKHIRAVVTEWERCGQAPSTLLDKISILRSFCIWIGKGGMVENPGDYVRDPRSLQIEASTDNSWQARGVDAANILARVKEKDVNVAIALELCLEFGIRPSEVISLNILGAQDCGLLLVREKKKGARVRAIPIERGSQRNALDVAAANLDKRGTIRIRGETDEQKLRRFYYILERVGITKKQIGVTAIGASEQYKDSVCESSGTEIRDDGNGITRSRYRCRSKKRNKKPGVSPPPEASGASDQN